MSIDISPRRVFLCLIAISSGLVVLHIIGQVSRLSFDHGNLKGLVPLFNLEDEYNIPSFWSSVQWLMAAMVAYSVTLCERSRKTTYWVYWSAIAAMCLLFAVDETVQLHERLGAVLQSFAIAEGVKPSGFLFYLWVIPGGIFALAVFALFFRFLLALPRNVAFLLVASGMVYVSGAIGFEMFEGRVDANGGYMGPLYTALVTFEESFEMFGVCIFVYAMLHYLGLTSRQIELTINSR
ncbi:MAG: hypothetical protein WC655_29250 [Candidatus Hydrogenedentales bacterium]